MDVLSILRGLTVAALPIVISITFHEIAHGWVAYKLGDPTAKSLGRLTINPIAHIDPVGTIVVPIMLFVLSKGTFMFGTAKPVPVNFGNLRNPRRDSAIVSAAGPTTNILIALISIVLLFFIYRLFSQTIVESSLASKILVPVMQMLKYSISFNIFIAAFNLLPVPPLDGGRILTSLLPHRYAYQFSKIEPYGIIIVLILWFTGIAHYIILPIQLFIQFIIRIFLIPFGG